VNKLFKVKDLFLIRGFFSNCFLLLLAAVAAAAVSSGVALTAPENTTAPFNPYGDFVPPTCAMEPEMKVGYVELAIQDFPPDALDDPANKLLMEE
jgi:hypothetical protein